MKQTAVEWLYEEMDRGDWDSLPKSMKSEIFEQAKEMEKQQVIKAVYDGMGTNFDPNMGRAEQYYNETFKS
jgi:hypothetical protein